MPINAAIDRKSHSLAMMLSAAMGVYVDKRGRSLNSQLALCITSDGPQKGLRPAHQLCKANSHPVNSFVRHKTQDT